MAGNTPIELLQEIVDAFPEFFIRDGYEHPISGADAIEWLGPWIHRVAALDEIELPPEARRTKEAAGE